MKAASNGIEQDEIEQMIYNIRMFLARREEEFNTNQ